MSRWGRLPSPLGVVALVLFAVMGFKAAPAQTVSPAADAVDVLQVDLDPLIDNAVKDRNRFAVDIPHVVDAATAGTWSVTNGVATWRYSMRIPTAVSLSFHAPNISLPPSAQLSVQAGGDTYVYRAKDANGGQLWSRISKGDSLTIELTVLPRERRAVVLQIASFQAGYRGFGHAVPDHPRYTLLRQRALTASTSTCIVNYECDVTAANGPPGQATVALIIDNSFQCSGTLLNDVPQDGKPYVLTARHCENGKLGGGNPGAAAGVVVYWDATSACGVPLATLYNSRVPTQQRATTVAEQQDAWLLLLDEPVAVSDAYMAGFDATGGVIQGGYTIHHALSNDKQLTIWNGQAVSEADAPNAATGVPYTSNFWDVINLIGTIGPGASGSALFDQNDRVVGSLSLASEADATSDQYDACPLSPPPTPTRQNALAFFTSLAAVWNSTADPTGSASTIKQVLDPNNTATLVVNSIPAPETVQLDAANLITSIDGADSLSWSAPGALSCTASGGIAGDGWSGTLPASSNQVVVETAVSTVTYGISCLFPDGHTSNAQVTINWVLADPFIILSAPAETWAGGSVPLSWATNVPPCQLTVGSTTQVLPGSSGTMPVTQNTPGKYDYHLMCGSSGRTAVEDATVTFVTPSVSFYPNTTDLHVGQVLVLSWGSLANSCTTSGGMPNDGWSGAQVAGEGGQSFFNVGLGTYTYALNCVQGQASAQASVTVTVENDPEYATLSVSSNAITTGQTVAVSYKSNLGSCDLQENRVGTQPPGISLSSVTGGSSEGTRIYLGGNAGATQLTYVCGEGGTNPTIVSATPQTVTVYQPVSASISMPASAINGEPFTITWQTTDATSCTPSGGGADGTQWAGNIALPSGQQTVTPTTAGTFTYTLTCVGEVPDDATTVQGTIKVAGGATAPSAPSAGSGGGGGAFDGLTLAMLGLATVLRSRRRPAPFARRPTARL